MSVKLDDLTGMLNLISHEKHIQHLDDLVTRYRELVCQLCTVIEMECMSEQEYILEIYDEAFGTGQRVINNEFPLATTSEEFVAMIGKMERSVYRLEAVKRVLKICFINNFIRFDDNFNV
ncbi:Phage protein [Caenorhabditis elegans]|uniref:Phage protein n=1 Tax=Caenorhabditis elegans TaxID=6239 RepID=Q20506_CAEEL|nr:Phage protein [Caenorhabditis elegans]CAA91986.2 Phage protein [Caenorhabditis elegans]|eukprot:NP_509816.2 Uncharacterized protein CELE_F47B10.6 [Caenorhabditis elegans]